MLSPLYLREGVLDLLARGSIIRALIVLGCISRNQEIVSADPVQMFIKIMVILPSLYGHI